MREFKILEHTADIGIKAYGKTKREIFINSAKGMFEIIAGNNNSLINENFSCKIELKGESLEDLLVTWLNELIFISETKLAILCKFNIKEFSDNKIEAEVKGVKIGQHDRRIEREIKAVTYHCLEIKKNNQSGLWSARVIFDI